MGSVMRFRGKNSAWWPLYMGRTIPDPTRSSSEDYEGQVQKLTQEIAATMDEIHKAFR